MRSINSVASMIEYAMCFVGTAYKWGGANPVEGFDCSGFIQEALASIGLDPRGDQTAQAMYDYFKHSSLRIQATGALAFYGESDAKITHIALMLNDHQIIEAGGGGSKTITRDDAAKQSAFVRVRPFGHRKDLVAVLMPSYP